MHTGEAKRGDGGQGHTWASEDNEGEGEGEDAAGGRGQQGQAQGRTSEGVVRRTSTCLQENIERYFLFLVFILVCRFGGSSLFAFYGIAWSPVSSLDFSRHRS